MIEKIKKIMLEAKDSRFIFFSRLSSAARILDMGCGDGGNARIVKKIYPHIEIHGIDIFESSPAADILYKKVDLEEGNLAYPDNYFDAIIFSHVIEHLKHPFKIASEIYRVLKNGGILYVETPNWTSILVPSFSFAREQMHPFNFYDDASHVQPWTKQGLYGYIVNSCKLKPERIDVVRNWPKIPFDFFQIIRGLLTRNRPMIVNSFWNIYGWSIYGTARKVSS